VVVGVVGSMVHTITPATSSTFRLSDLCQHDILLHCRTPAKMTYHNVCPAAPCLCCRLDRLTTSAQQFFT
jgi:hypothetical protein